MSQLTPEAKAALSRTIRELRARLLRDIHDEAESVYRLSIKDADKAGLREAALVRRKRLERWFDERSRGVPEKQRVAARERFRAEAEAEAAHTLLNRLVLLRHLEALGLSRPMVVTGGWRSVGYKEFRSFSPGLCGDPQDLTEGYRHLLEMVFDELAVDLPGLFGDVGLTRLFPAPAPTLREVIEKLDAPELSSAWGDDTTLGWVYQYWNDPSREALDAKIAGGGKVEPHEIASKTQMFTERYMVEWLLHNSLGLMWLCMCRRNGWTADVEGQGVLDALDARRADWRSKREKGEVPLDALMPVEAGLEDRWKYYVKQPIPGAAVEKAPTSVRDLKILDPACGSGHFLVIAFDLLAELYKEEARHRGLTWSDREIAGWIVEENLHGVDIDPRAVQIAAAGLLLKARGLSREVSLRRMNLVAPRLELGKLPKDDPALVELRRGIKQEAGIPEAVTEKIVTALAGVDHLGTLLKVDKAVAEAIEAYEKAAPARGQRDWVKEGEGTAKKPSTKPPLRGFEETKATVLGKLERFLAQHASEAELGIRLDGEQLAAGLRFVRLVKEGTYDLVIGNPPYSDISKLTDTAYLRRTYPLGKMNLYAAFMERGFDLAREGGLMALVTMRGWMFLAELTRLRMHLFKMYDLRLLGDMDRGAFEDIPDEQVAVSIATFIKACSGGTSTIALQPTLPEDKARDSGRTQRKRASLLAQVGRFEFWTSRLSVIPGQSVVYWWSQDFLARYASAPKLGDRYAVRQGASTTDNVRFVRKPWELAVHACAANKFSATAHPVTRWIPYVKGAAGLCWFEPVSDAVQWGSNGLQVKTCNDYRYGSFTRNIRNESFYFRPGIAFSMIGASFTSRAHRVQSIIADVGSSVYPDDIAVTVCVMNTSAAKQILASLNPTLHFLVGDVNRLPIFPVENADEIYKTIDHAFTEHEAARETSIEYKTPGPSPWDYAQSWAQQAVDRPAGAPLPPYTPVYTGPEPVDYVSHAFGLALGRFPLGREPSHDSLPAGILYLSAAAPDRDSLAAPACAPLHAAWANHGPAIDPKLPLHAYLRTRFFDHHRKLYENRPIYLPLSSAKRSFVAWISIHRWTITTLSTLLADHLLPERLSLEGQLDDLRKARASTDAKQRAAAEKRFGDAQKLHEELSAFIDLVTACDAKGPPPTGATPEREADARYVPDLDDGVMVNSAALWPLLDPQWKDPKKWWRELVAASGQKDYDWSHLAARYFPKRVDEKCKKDPSLAVAHGCFWRYHPARAYAWELRLQDESGPDFTIEEPGAAEARAAFLTDRKDEARAIEKAEQKRRERKAEKARKAEGDDDQAALPFGDEESGDEGSD